jgi:hypothetical protein
LESAVGFGVYAWHLGQDRFKLPEAPSFRTFLQMLDRRESGHFPGDRSGDEPMDVTIILSKKRCNEGPKPTKILVTNLPDARARQVVDVYRRRWSVELLVKELKGAMGLGQHQVTKEPQRVERSVAISVMAFLMILKCRARDIPEQGAWSMFTLKRNLMWQVAQGQLGRSVQQRLRKGLQERKAA